LLILGITSQVASVPVAEVIAVLYLCGASAVGVALSRRQRRPSGQEWEGVQGVARARCYQFVALGLFLGGWTLAEGDWQMGLFLSAAGVLLGLRALSVSGVRIDDSGLVYGRLGACQGF
jgi:energy-converting hydrogenase Eha subunit G